MASFRPLLLTVLLAGCPSNVPETADSPSGGSDAGPPDAGPTLDAPVPEDAPRAPTIGYLEDVAPMFEARGCATFACHGSVLSAGTLLYMPSPRIAYEDMIDRPSVRESRVIVAPGRPDASILVEHAETVLLDADVIETADAELVRAWVADGAALSRGGAGGGADAGVPDDAGMGPGGGGDTCDLAASHGWEVLPAGCVPRCSRATWDAVVACRDDADPNTCQNAVIDADTTPSISAPGAVEPVDIDCNLCLTWQSRSCFEEACPHQLLALDRCTVFDAASGCTEEANALSSCLSLHPESRTCQRMRDPACVAP